MRDMQALSDVVVLAIKAALAPLEARLRVSEQANQDMYLFGKEISTLRDRLVVIETKAAIVPEREPDTLADLRARVAFVETRVLDESQSKAVADIRERLAVVETRAQVPGPAGKDGEPGPAGKDGVDGLAGLSFEGVYQDGQSYEKGQLVTWAGSSWHCNAPTTTKPGDGSKDWTLMVKRGRDGKDGRDGHDLAPVVRAGVRE